MTGTMGIIFFQKHISCKHKGKGSICRRFCKIANKWEGVSDKMDELLGFLPGKLVLICTLLAFLVPFSVYKINQKLHENGDPTWKKEEEKGQPK